MYKEQFKTSSFGLAKGKNLVSDDFFSVQVYEDIAIAVMCDGVGSAHKGREASRRIVNYLVNNFKNRPCSWSIKKSLDTFIKNINTILYRESIDEYERPEYVSTLAVIVIEGSRLYGANVGDSPIFLLRRDHLQQLSFDHISDEKGMEHVLTQAMGLDEHVEPYHFENKLEAVDKLLLCSDGLSNLLDNQTLRERLDLGAPSLVKHASKSVDDDLPDDTSAITVEFAGIPTHQILKQVDLPIPEILKKDQIIDGYTLLEPLITDRRTWLVRKNGKEYVMKFPQILAKDDDKLLDLFIKEAWNATRLKAGFFPKAVIPKNRTMRYYVMPFIESVRLKEIIAKKPLPIEDAINLGKFLLNACQFLLKYDLVHGDIKPENILVVERNGKRLFKLIDFGSIVEVFSIASRAGTPSYLAPERFTGEPISEQTEIFSIGVTLYEVLSRKYPYGEIEPFQTPTFKASKSPKEYNKVIPVWLESIILRAIEADSKQRYGLYSEMEFELTSPDKVKPYFKKGSTLLERQPILYYRLMFTVSFVINLYLLTLVLK